MLHPHKNFSLWRDRVHTLSHSGGALLLMPKPPGASQLPHFIAFLRSIETHTLVSMLQPVEQQRLGLADCAACCQNHGIEYRQHPIPDHGTPGDAAAFIRLAGELAEQLRAGRRVAIHCYAGIGRTGLMAASALMHLGESVDTAVIKLSRARTLRMPETLEQIQFLHRISGDIPHE